MTVSQSTLSGNSTTGIDAEGGAIYAGAVTVSQSTITGNQSTLSVGGGIYSFSSPITIQNSIVAGNTDYNGNAPDIRQSGTLTVSHSLIGDNTGTTLTEAQAVDIDGNFIGSSTGGGIIVPLLGPLQNNGGPTFTHALLTGSLALNSGDNTLIPLDTLDLDGDLNTTEQAPFDQRGVGFARIFNTTVDMGAFESLDAVNQAPVLSGIESTFLPYAPAAAATAITATLQVSDADSANLASATIEITGGYQSGDVLAFSNTANITGVWNGTGLLTLTGSDTVANYQAALRSVTYVSSSQSPVARTVSFQVNDGTDLSNVATRTIGGEVQLVGTTFNIYGTTGVDTIAVTEGSTLMVTRNAVNYNYTSTLVTMINVYGNGGTDTLTFTGTTGDETATLRANNTLDVTGPGYTLHAESVETVYVYSGGGTNDEAYLYDSAGNDTFYGTPTASLLSGTGFFHYAQGFDKVYAIANAGGTDTLNVHSISYLFFQSGSWEILL